MNNKYKNNRIYKLKTEDIIIYFLYVIIIITTFISFINIILKYGIDEKYLINFYGIYTLSVILVVILDKKIKKMTPGFIVLVYMLFTNMGYTLLYFISSDDYFRLIKTVDFFNGEYVYLAFGISSIALTSMLLGIRFTGSNNNNIVNIKESQLINIYVKISFILIFIFTIYLLVAILTGTLPISKYSDFIEFKSTSPTFNYLLRYYWIGCVAIFAAGSRKYLIMVLPFIIMISSILLITGNRNEALIPLVISLGIYIIRFNYIPKLMTALFIIIIFIINPIISATRKTDLTDRELEFGMQFQDSIIEMGAQVRPFSYMLSWLEHGMDYAYGLTYIYPSMAVLFRSNQLIEKFENSRYDISNTMGGSGLAFSSIAEVYYNFGIIGIIITFTAIGIFISKNEKQNISQFQLLLYGQVMILMFHLVRNSFKYSITHVIWVLLFFITGWFIYQLIYKKSKKEVTKNKK